MTQLSERARNNLQERDDFVKHMLDYPDSCADVASLLVYAIANKQKDYRTAEAMLKGILQRHPYESMKRTTANDKTATAKLGGCILDGLRRPEIMAGLHMALHYKETGDIRRSCKTAKEFVAAISSDGFYWEMNKSVGDILITNASEKRDAEAQYRLALAGYLEYVGREVLRARTDKRKMRSEEWGKTILDLKKCIQKAGGQVAMDAKELKAITTSISSQQDTASLEKGKIRQRMQDVYKKQGDLSTATGRRLAVEKIAEAVLQKQVGDSNEKKPTHQDKASFAIGLAQLASEEPDSETRRIMLGKMDEISSVQSAGKSDQPIAQTDRQKVDRLIKQMSGETGIEGAVADPQSELSGVDVGSLLYAAERVEQGSLPLQTRQTITKALATSGNPALFKFFADIVQRAEDEKLTRFAVRGLERILEKTQGGHQIPTR